MRMMDYPKTAAQLPEDLWSQAYTEDDPPITISMPRVATIAANHVPLRRTSKLLLVENPNAGVPSRRNRPQQTMALMAPEPPALPALTDRPTVPPQSQNGMLAIADGDVHGYGGGQPEPLKGCLLYTSPSPRDGLLSRMPSSA